MNSEQRNISFTTEREENNSLSYLDIKFFLDVGKFHNSVCRRRSFCGASSNFEVF